MAVMLVCPYGSATAQRIPAVALRSGSIGRYLWWSSLEAPELAKERERGYVCLAISMLEPLPSHRAEGSAVAGCGPPPSGHPMVEYLEGGEGKRVRTVIAALFPVGVRQVYLKTVGTPGREYPSSRLSEDVVQGVSARPLAFFAHGFATSACIQGMVGYGAKGEVLSRLGRQGCP